MSQLEQESLARLHKEQGAQQLAKGKVELALAEYQQAQAAAPGDVMARRKVAELLARLGRKVEAISAYQLLAGRFAAEGRLLEAIAICKVLLQLDPAHVETQTSLSKLYALRSAEPGATGRETMPASMSGAIDFTHAPAARRRLETPVAGSTPMAGVPRAASASRSGAPPQDLSPRGIDIDVSALPQAPLFSGLPPEVMQILLERLTLHPFVAGEAIVKEGETGRSLFVLASGNAKVARNVPGGARKEVDQMPEGSFFGEIGLIADVPRLASVIATEDCVVLEISRDLIASLNKKFPGLDAVVRDFYKARLLANLMRSSAIFQPLNAAERAKVIDKFTVKSAAAGEVLLKQGEAARGLFLLLRGRCSVSYRDVGDEEHALPSLSEGAVIGEISLISDGAVTATVTALVPSVLLFLAPAPFVEHLLSNPGARELMTKLTTERLARNDAVDQAVLGPAFL
jgi:cAMP-dependent protein kinase regulator